MEDEPVPTTCNFFKDPLSFSDLIGGGAKFEIDIDFDEGRTSAVDDEMGSDEEEVEDVDQSALISPWTKSFDELKKQMVRINKHIHKKVIKPGNEEMGMVPTNSRVRLRYNAYWELESAPFDSSFLRGASFSFYTGCNEVLEGLEAAVRTMHIGEHSQFIISYELLFREMGCPPRVRPKADGLFIMELIGFNLVGDLNAEKQLSEEDRNKYSLVVDKVKDIHLKGLDFFSQKQYKNAIRAFEKAVSVLHFCRLANEEEQRDQTTFLIKLYTNLAVCFIKCKIPTKACIMVKDIRRLTDNRPSCKAAFQEGRALLMLGEFDQARRVLLYAQRLEPHNEDIANEIRLLEQRNKCYKANEKNIWTKAMGVITEPEVIKPIIDLESAFAQQMSEVLKSFKESDEKSFKLPPGLVPEEMQAVSGLAKTLELKLNHSPLDDSVTLCKK